MTFKPTGELYSGKKALRARLGLEREVKEIVEIAHEQVVTREQLVDEPSLFQPLKNTTTIQAGPEVALLDLSVQSLEELRFIAIGVEKNLHSSNHDVEAFLGAATNLPVTLFEGVPRPTTHPRQVLVIHLYDVVQDGLVGFNEKARDERVSL